MKFSKILFISIFALFAVACNGSGNGEGSNENNWQKDGSPVGEWSLSLWNNSQNLPFAVYMRFNEDGTFDIYQHTYSVLWVHYNGTFTLEGNTLSGVYSDGEAWASDYTIAYHTSPKQIRLTRVGDAEGKDISIYDETEIPALVMEEATDAVNVRSVSISRLL